LKATIQVGEGNSCLIIGPQGSGKTKLVDDVLASLPGKPIIVRLSGHVQKNDLAALREISRQVAKQTQKAFGTELEDNVDEDELGQSLNSTPSSHLPSLISSLPTLGRPTILVMDSFDLFAEHGRQALLYCLLDTAQSCRAGTSTKGIAVVGVTSRVDTINVLEKRVKSRFSGRIMRTSGMDSVTEWTRVVSGALLTNTPTKNEEWTKLWSTAVERFLEDRAVNEALSETYGLAKDVRVLCRILTGPISALTPDNPYPKSSTVLVGITDQRSLPAFPFLSSLPYPAICLLIAAIHERTAGNDVFTFEMLYESFRSQLRSSLSAPVQVEGGSIGMVRCSRSVLLATFERMVDSRVFIAVPGSSGSTPQFTRHRCTVEHEQVKRAIEAVGQTNLKKWFNKAT